MMQGLRNEALRMNQARQAAPWPGLGTRDAVDGAQQQRYEGTA
jgi:hypothetical protein